MKLPVKTTKRFQYIESFDTIRGLGRVLILLVHGTFELFKGGFIAVDLSFVLSGYLITSVLQNEFSTSGNISLYKYYARRALRIFPVLIAGVLLGNILWNFQSLYTGTDRLLATTGALFYFNNFIPIQLSGNMVHLWSLSVEEHFYFLWPLLLLFVILKLPVRNRILFLISLITGFTIFKIFAFNYNWQYGLFVIDSYRSTFCRVDVILMGALLALSMPKLKIEEITANNKTKSTLMILILLGVLLTIFCTIPENNIYWGNGGFILTNLLCAFVILVAIKYSNHYLFSNKILRWIGKRSYGIYVYHFPIFLALEGLRQHHNPTSYILVTILRFVLSFIAAAISYKYLELPLLKYKKRFSVQSNTAVKLTELDTVNRKLSK